MLDQVSIHPLNLVDDMLQQLNAGGLRPYHLPLHKPLKLKIVSAGQGSLA